MGDHRHQRNDKESVEMIEPKNYQKKPVIVQAMRYPLDEYDEVDDFVQAAMGVYNWVTLTAQAYNPGGDARPVLGASFNSDTGEMTIATLEGEMRVNPGDYIIRGVQGEFCLCKPEIFDATYTEVK